MARTYSKRTDPHRPGALVPAHYDSLFCFNMSSSMDGWPIPSFRVNCELDGRVELKDAEGKITFVNGTHSASGTCCVVGLRMVGGAHFANGGGPGQCTVCGARYIHGEVWRHRLTGDIIFLGHDCAEKYGFLIDASEAELAHERARNATAKAILAVRTKQERIAFFAGHPGLEAALGRNHRILFDLAAKLHQYRTLSDKQIALALRIAHELDHPAAAEVTVPAPTGKQTFVGTVVSTKVMEGSYGPSVKMTVKVTTPAGVWLAWGTVPALILEQKVKHGNQLRGAEVEITATLKAGREPHFAIMGRPRGEALAFACEQPEACEGCQRALLGDEAYEVREFVKWMRSDEAAGRAAGLFDQAVYAQGFADEAERTGKLPAADRDGRTPSYIWYRAYEGKRCW